MHNNNNNSFGALQANVGAENSTLLTAIAVFLVIGRHFESHLSDHQGELNYFLIDHSFPTLNPFGIK